MTKCKTAKRVMSLENLLDDSLTKSDFIQFKDELLETFRELIKELEPNAPAREYEGRDYG